MFSLKHEKYAYIKDGLAAYRNITQSSNVSSLETVLKSYLSRVEDTFAESIKDIEDPIAYLQEVDKSNNPEDFYLNCYNNDYDQ